MFGGRSSESGRLEGMRVERSFAFLDLSGFTRFGNAQGDDEALVVLAGFRTVVRDEASNHGIRVAKWLGDGAMLVSVDDRELVGAVLDIRRELELLPQHLPIHAGIARGPVIVFEGDDYLGSAINVAARLCEIAGPGEVLIVESEAYAAPSWADVQDAGVRELAGFAHPVAIKRLVDPSTAEIHPRY